MNLTSNAIKFTEAGRVEIRLCVPGPMRWRWSSGAAFDVIDTGIGLTPDSRAGCFTAFTQADESTSRRYGGTGLGLAISRHLAELLDGTIQVQRRIGRGSRFTLHLPLSITTSTRSRCSSTIASTGGKHLPYSQHLEIQPSGRKAGGHVCHVPVRNSKFLYAHAIRMVLCLRNMRNMLRGLAGPDGAAEK